MAGVYNPFVDDVSFGHFRDLRSALGRVPGVAVLGAGASAPLPNWTGLYDRVRDRARGAGVFLPVNDGRLGLVTLFAEARRLIGSVPLLSTVREELATSAGVPEVYELVRTTNAFQSIQTFNYDNYLRLTSQREEGETNSYPFSSWNRMSARFMYLHGDLESAATIDDLVLCEDSYQRAYAQGTDLVDILNFYFKRLPVVFIGSSLSDEAFMKAVFQIHSSISIATTSSSEEMVLTDRQWFAFFPKEPTHIMDAMNTKMQVYHVKPIWYESDGSDHSALLTALNLVKTEIGGTVSQTSQSPDSLLKAREASRLALVEKPNHIQTQLAAEMLRDRHARGSFLRDVSSAGWFRLLASQGFLDPDAPEAVDGGLSARPWDGAGYLAKIAASSPALVVQYLRHFQTQNWLAKRDLTLVLAALPTSEFWALAGRIPEWLVGPWGNAELLSLVLDRMDAEVGRPETVPLLARIGEQLSDAVENDVEIAAIGIRAANSFALAARKNPRVATDLLRLVGQRARKEWPHPAADASWIRIRAIGHVDSYERRDGFRWLLGTTVAVFEALRESDGYEQAIRTSLKSRWPLVRRLALHELSLTAAGRARVSQELESVLLKSLDSTAVFHESAEIVSALVASTQESDRNLLRTVEGLVAQHPGPRWDRWRRILSGRPSEGDLYLFGPVEIFTPTAPVDSAEVASRFGHLGPSDLLSLAKRPSEFGIEIGWRDSADLIWDSLADYVVESGRLDVLFALTPEDAAQFEDSHRLIRISGQLAVSASERTRLSRWLVSIAKKGGSPAHAALDALVEIGERWGTPASVTKGALDIVLDQGWPTDMPLQRGSVWTEGEPPDVMMRQLNDPAGKAAQILVESFFRTRRLGINGATLPAWISTFCRPQYARIVECRVALGEVFPFVVVADRSQAVEALQAVFGLDAPPAAVEPFWAGYCWRAQPHRETLELLAPQLRAACGMTSEFVHVGRDVKEQLASHAAIGWIQGLEGYSQLPEAIFKSPDGGAIRRFVWATGQVLRGAPEDLRRRCPQLLGELVAADPREPGGESGYASWLWTLKEAPLTADIIPPLRAVFPRLVGGDLNAALELLNQLAAAMPRECLELFAAYAIPHASDAQLRWDSPRVFQLLKALSEAAVDRPLLSNVVTSLLESDALSVAQADQLGGLAPVLRDGELRRSKNA